MFRHFFMFVLFIYFSNALDEERRTVADMTAALSAERLKTDQLTSDLQKTLKQYQKLQQVRQTDNDNNVVIAGTLMVMLL